MTQARIAQSGKWCFAEPVMVCNKKATVCAVWLEMLGLRIHLYFHSDFPSVG